MNQMTTQSTVGTAHKSSTEDCPLVQVTKTFHAPVGRVFETWQDVTLLHHWWGPESFTCPYARVDFKVGGKYLFAMRSLEEKSRVLWTTGTFIEIEADRRIVMTDLPSDRKGNVVSAEEAGYDGPYADIGLSFITAEFEPMGENTILRLSHEGLPARVHQDCVDGWSSSLEKIRPLVEGH